MNGLYALTIVFVVYALGDMIATKTKAITVLQHTDEQAHIPHIHLEGILLGIFVQRQLRNGEVIAAGDDPRILNPLLPLPIRLWFYFSIP